MNVRVGTTMTDDIAAARAAIAGVPFFRSEDPAALFISRMGGLTNRVFKVETEGDAYVLRLVRGIQLFGDVWSS